MEEVMVEFTGGGLLDGKTLASGEDPEFDTNKAKWVFWAATSSLNIAERKEKPPGTLLIWRVPCAHLSGKAKAEQWSDAKVKALMRYHEYHILKLREHEGIILLTAYYRGVN
jgi:hypothetical protein